MSIYNSNLDEAAFNNINQQIAGLGYQDSSKHPESNVMTATEVQAQIAAANASIKRERDRIYNKIAATEHAAMMSISESEKLNAVLGSGSAYNHGSQNQAAMNQAMGLYNPNEEWGAQFAQRMVVQSPEVLIRERFKKSLAMMNPIAREKYRPIFELTGIRVLCDNLIPHAFTDHEVQWALIGHTIKGQKVRMSFATTGDPGGPLGVWDAMVAALLDQIAHENIATKQQEIDDENPF